MANRNIDPKDCSFDPFKKLREMQPNVHHPPPPTEEAIAYAFETVDRIETYSRENRKYLKMIGVKDSLKRCLLARDRFTAMEEMKDPRIRYLVQSELKNMEETGYKPDPTKEGPVPMVCQIALHKTEPEHPIFGKPPPPKLFQ
jgi:hypothetical protein